MAASPPTISGRGMNLRLAGMVWVKVLERNKRCFGSRRTIHGSERLDGADSGDLHPPRCLSPERDLVDGRVRSGRPDIPAHRHSRMASNMGSLGHLRPVDRGCGLSVWSLSARQRTSGGIRGGKALVKRDMVVGRVLFRRVSDPVFYCVLHFLNRVGLHGLPALA